MTTATASEVTIRNGRPYTSCTTCDASGEAQFEGDPFCHDCFGTTFSPVFEANRFSFAATAEFQTGAPEGNSATSGGGRAKKNWANRYDGVCIKCHTPVPADTGYCIRDGQGWAITHKVGECSEKAEAAPAKSVRPNKYAGNCDDCGQRIAAEAGELIKTASGWGVKHIDECPLVQTEIKVEATSINLSEIPSGRYAVPNGDTRLKLQIDNVTEGKWAGWVFVKDAAVYGSGQKYGAQRPGQNYSGQVEDELRSILADPKAASIAYGKLTGTCGRCNTILENKSSIAAGIGPVCATKF